MGTTLHNKIYLGRTSILSSRKAQAALMVCAVVSIAVIWTVLGLRIG